LIIILKNINLVKNGAFYERLIEGDEKELLREYLKYFGTDLFISLMSEKYNIYNYKNRNIIIV